MRKMLYSLPTATPTGGLKQCACLKKTLTKSTGLASEN
jgi:hypothetical protein